MVKNLPAKAGDARDAGSLPGLGRSLGVGNGNPLQSSCLANPMDRGAWQATGHSPGSRKELTRLSTAEQPRDTKLPVGAQQMGEVGFLASSPGHLSSTVMPK